MRCVFFLLLQYSFVLSLTHHASNRHTPVKPVAGVALSTTSLAAAEHSRANATTPLTGMCKLHATSSFGIFSSTASVPHRCRLCKRPLQGWRRDSILPTKHCIGVGRTTKLVW